jgi:hypothetical protein
MELLDSLHPLLTLNGKDWLSCRILPAESVAEEQLSASLTWMANVSLS